MRLDVVIENALELLGKLQSSGYELAAVETSVHAVDLFDWQPRFLANPCEDVPSPEPAPRAVARIALAPHLARGIDVLPDLSRRTPVVDPDDHHLFVSLGCAAENLALAAMARGCRGDPMFDDAGVLDCIDLIRELAGRYDHRVGDAPKAAEILEAHQKPNMLPKAERRELAGISQRDLPGDI